MVMGVGASLVRGSGDLCLHPLLDVLHQADESRRIIHRWRVVGVLAEHLDGIFPGLFGLFDSQCTERQKAIGPELEGTVHTAHFSLKYIHDFLYLTYLVGVFGIGE